jgi:hypothetical protein
LARESGLVFRKIGREFSVTHKKAQRVIAEAIAEEGSQ